MGSHLNLLLATCSIYTHVMTTAVGVEVRCSEAEHGAPNLSTSSAHCFPETQIVTANTLSSIPGSAGPPTLTFHDLSGFSQWPVCPNLMKSGIELSPQLCSSEECPWSCLIQYENFFFSIFNTCVDLSTSMGLVCFLLFIQLVRSQKWVVNSELGPLAISNTAIIYCGRNWRQNSVVSKNELKLSLPPLNFPFQFERKQDFNSFAF